MQYIGHYVCSGIELLYDIYDFMIDSLITVIYFCYVTPSSDWDTHSPNRLSASI